MKKFLYLLLLMGSVPALGWCQYFKPGNILFADPTGDQVIELTLKPATGEAEIIKAVKWPLGDTSRRRPLGLDISPNGDVWVGITGVPTSATEAVEFPTGRGEALRIAPDGKQTFYILPINKATFLSTFRPNEVYVMSNDIKTAPSSQWRIRVDGDQIVEETEFIVSQSVNFYGEALELGDGRVLIANSGTDGIQVYDRSGKQTGMFVTTGRFRSLTYIPELDKIIALGNDQQTISRFNMQGNLEESVNANDFFYPSLWGIARMPGTTKIILGSHNGPANTKNYIGVFDAANLQNPPEEYLISGLANAGLPDSHLFASLFNIGVAIEPKQVPVQHWDIH